MDFQVVGPIRNIQVIAVAHAIRELKRLRKAYGGTRWRKLKGDATVRISGGTMIPAEVHWYEAHGVGKREMKIKRFLDE